MCLAESLIVYNIIIIIYHLHDVFISIVLSHLIHFMYILVYNLYHLVDLLSPL